VPRAEPYIGWPLVVVLCFKTPELQ
jgi:hypothetical protein